MENYEQTGKTLFGSFPVDDFKLRDDAELSELLQRETHLYHGGARCETDAIGYPTPSNRSPTELVVNSTLGFIPLWDRGVTLRWRFQKQSLLPFVGPEAIKQYVRGLLGDAILAWGRALPVKFSEVPEQPWDFEVVIRSEDDCNPAGCVLARAFFPDAGQHELMLFPRMFTTSRQEQIETITHELGHVFGLRHFFALVSEAAFPAEVFGEHNKFTIMNYGEDSRLTETDIEDLMRLYQQIWSGQRTEINGTPIRLVTPFSHAAVPVSSMPLLALAASARPLVATY